MLVFDQVWPHTENIYHVSMARSRFKQSMWKMSGWNGDYFKVLFFSRGNVLTINRITLFSHQVPSCELNKEIVLDLLSGFIGTPFSDTNKARKSFPSYMESRECNLLGYIQKDVIDFHTNLSVQYYFIWQYLGPN